MKAGLLLAAGLLVFYSRRLYAGLGFRFTAPRATFHWLRR